MDGWKFATGLAVAVAAVAVAVAWRRGRRMLPPKATPRKPDDESTGLAALVFKKGAKAVAEASKEAQLGEVLAHDRKAAQEQLKAG